MIICTFEFSKRSFFQSQLQRNNTAGNPVLAAAGAHDAQVARRGEASALAAHLAARGMQTRSTDTNNIKKLSMNKSR